MANEKIKWETPELVDLSKDITRGECTAGTTNAGTCAPGASDASFCVSGVTNTPGCSTGNSAGTCVSGPSKV